VDADELDVALDELEIRLERLRALYEQYFLGIEKLEPSVLRKDVDRRFWLLRREKIRNTAKRFKLQTLIQRYNTFQQYWQRICREMETGTYRRHLLRAERTFGPGQLLTIAARRRFAPELRRDEETGDGEPVLRGRSANEAEMGDSPSQPTLQESPPAAAAPRPEPHTAPVTRARNFAALTLDFDSDSSAPPDRGPKPSTPEGLRKAVRAGEPVVPKRAEEAARAPETKRPAGQSASAGITEERIRDLHERLEAAREKAKDSTQVSVEGLAKSLRAAEAQLKKRHGDRDIDFEIVVKGSRVLVKPVVR
jgi:hypothetical protein